MAFLVFGNKFRPPVAARWRTDRAAAMSRWQERCNEFRSVLNFNYKNRPPRGQTESRPMMKWLYAAAPRIVPSARQTALVLGLAVATTGCQHLLEDTGLDNPRCDRGCDATTSKPGREVAMNRLWQHRRLSELKAKLGPPLMIMGIPGGGNPPGFVAVYGTDPVTGCVDAFAFTHSSDPVIRVYHCR